MKSKFSIFAAVSLMALASCSNNKSGETVTTPATLPSSGVPDSAKRLKIGYVLHGLNDFTNVIKRGAEDAGRALGVDVEVTGPSTFTATDAIGIFETMIQKKKDGLIVVPMPGDVWVKPIKEATDAKIDVLTANMISENSTSASWFGQDEYQSGVILAQQIRKLLEADKKTSGKILAGICAPSVAVLVDRYKGFQEGLKGSAFTVTDAKDVGTENTKNYAAWENLAAANPDIVASVGLCSMDIPNLAKLKVRTKANWIIGGYDLNNETIESLKSGVTGVSLGQHPYLQGYLPVLALVHQLRDKKGLPKGWVDVGTEIVTKANVESITPRETDHAKETAWYAEDIKKRFMDISGMGKPLPLHK